MLQSLLADRFKLRFHKEVRDLSVLGLVLAKNPPKFHELPTGAYIGPPWGIGHIRFRNLSELAAGLSWYFPDRPILNETGLTGDYDLRVDLTPYSAPDSREPGTTAHDWLLRAVLEQLGLKLVPMKRPVEMFVIDYVE